MLRDDVDVGGEWKKMNIMNRRGKKVDSAVTKQHLRPRKPRKVFFFLQVSFDQGRRENEGPEAISCPSSANEPSLELVVH